MRECYLCGANGTGEPLDHHHVFGGAYRKKSERYGAVVFLCHEKCHLRGKYAVHNNAQQNRVLKAEFQEKIMGEQGWTEDEFRAEFGKSYLL